MKFVCQYTLDQIRPQVSYDDDERRLDQQAACRSRWTPAPTDRSSGVTLEIAGRAGGLHSGSFGSTQQVAVRHPVISGRAFDDGVARQSQLTDGMDFELSNHTMRISHSEIERRRRNKLNSYIQDLATLVPLCRTVHSRKLDKLTILKMSVQYLKNVSRSATKSSGRSGKKRLPETPAMGQDLVTSQDLLQLCLTISDGFALVIDCNMGLVLFASETSDHVLDAPVQLTGTNIFDILHPADVPVVRHELSKFCPNPEHADHTTRSPLAQRTFSCRIQCPNPSVRESESYIRLSVTGFIKNLRPESTHAVEYGARSPSSQTLVALAQVLPSTPRHHESDSGETQLEFSCRFSPEAQFTAIDVETTAVLGYTFSEIKSSSLYRICHHEDVATVADSHRAVLRQSGPTTTPPYRLLCRNGEYVTVVTYWQALRNHQTKELDGLLACSRMAYQRKPVSPIYGSTRGSSEQLDDMSQQSSSASTGSTGGHARSGSESTHTSSRSEEGKQSPDRGSQATSTRRMDYWARSNSTGSNRQLR